MLDINRIGEDWIGGLIDGMIIDMPMPTPVEINEQYRYLPKSVAALHPGPMSYDKTPMWREVVNNADVNSPIREVTILKGVQVAFTTGVLEAAAFYFMIHVRTLTMMYATADNEMATDRVENSFIPMINEAGFSDIIQSNDVTSRNKTGKTRKRIQWQGGGSLIPIGALNAAKMRSTSISVMLKDELSGWPQFVGKDGDPDKLTDDRLKGQWDARKIFRGSTPSVMPDKTEKRYKEGDQRKYYVNCKHCGHNQYLIWHGENKAGEKFGFKWDYNKDGTIDVESVRYLCSECLGAHYEHDKPNLFSEKTGAKWKPTATPISKDIRSYHLPAFYSLFCPWSALVLDWLKAWDVENNEMKDYGLLQAFYNNVLALPWEVKGDRVSFKAVSSHRRTAYKFGEVPNDFALKHCDSKIIFITCQVDVQKRFLSVTVMGWTKGFQCFVIDYRELWVEKDEPDCTYIESPPWEELEDIICDAEFTADDGQKYIIETTAIDAGWGEAYPAVLAFCAKFSGVIPIQGRPSTGKTAKIVEFKPFTTKDGTEGFGISVDYYKERLAPVLRNEWQPDKGKQKQYHFNAPVDMTDKQIKELTAEVKKEKTDARNNISFEWVRRGRNELWDLLVYGHALVEIIAWDLFTRQYEKDGINWPEFWDFMEEKLAETQT